MGSLIGHSVPGAFFLIFSLWWYVGNLLRAKSAQQNSRSNRRLLIEETVSGANMTEPLAISNPRPWFVCPGVMGKVPIEPIFKIVCTVCGIVGELAPANHRRLLGENGELLMDNLNNYGHATMYAFFAFSGVVDLVMWYRLLPLPTGSDYVALSLAFLVEWMLFYFHLQGRPELDVRMHTILYVIIFASVVVLLVAAVWKSSLLPSIVLAFLTSLQGSWFIQIGISPHGANVWKETAANVMVVPILLGWHAMFWLVLYLLAFALVYRAFARRCLPMEHMEVGEQEDSEILGLMEM